MNEIALIISLAITVEALVEYVKTIAQHKSWKPVVLQLSALAVAVALCLVTGADMYSAIGVDFKYPVIGCILTGIFASRGANYISDLFGKINAKSVDSREE